MLDETIQSIIEWSAKTFPNATLDGQWDKFDEERTEWEQSDKDISELADMFIVACSIGRFNAQDAFSAFASIYEQFEKNHISWSVFQSAINKKMQINRARSWEGKDGQYKHKSEDDICPVN